MGCNSSKVVPVETERTITPDDNFDTNQNDDFSPYEPQVQQTNIDVISHAEEENTSNQESTQSIGSESDGVSNGYDSKTLQSTNKQDAPTTETELNSKDSNNQTENLQIESIFDLPTVPVIDEEREQVAEAYISFAEFPTHLNLRAANEKYAKSGRKIPIRADGQLDPFSSYRRKKDIFAIDKFRDLDQYAEQASDELMRQPVNGIVSYLNKKCSTDLQRVRAYFRWLVTRKVHDHIPFNEETEHPDSLLRTLSQLKFVGKSFYYQEIFADMCREGGIQAELIKGKVRVDTKFETDVENSDYVNTWVAVVIDQEWRFVDVNFAAKAATDGDVGAWELIDDDGKGRREVEPSAAGIEYAVNENYFLPDPDTFVYDHLPFEAKWQLLARYVTMNEFKEMAILQDKFFQHDLSVGNQVKNEIHASDGITEIDLMLPKGKHLKFMYQLWHSTKKGKIKSFDEFSLSQFVLLKRIDHTKLHCRVVFPEVGEYKIDLYCAPAKSTTLNHVCCYKLVCDQTNENRKALPRNGRGEWGYTEAMNELGLVPITHTDAVIESEDGNVEVAFKCTKGPIDALVKIHGENKTFDELQNHIVFRQNENEQLVISAKLEKKGLYALDILAKKQGTDGNNIPQIATYLISTTSDAIDPQPFPDIVNRRIGQIVGTDDRIQVIPISHPSSYITVDSENDLEITLKSLIPLEFLTELHHWKDGSSEEVSQYAFQSVGENKANFTLRFKQAGFYTFKIYAKPEDAEGSLSPVFIYLIYVESPNPKAQVFPKTYGIWGKGFDIRGLESGIVNVDEPQKITLTAPGAKNVAIIAPGNEWKHLTKMDYTENGWEGEMNIKTAGTVKISAQFNDDNTYNTLLAVEAKDDEERKKEEKRQAELEQQRLKEEEKREKERQNRLKKLQQQFAAAKTALQNAIQSRDVNKLKKAIAQVERFNYTKRLKQVYEEAKELKRSLEEIERLQKLVLTMDQKLMAVIRSYANPLPIIHVTMRATFLLLGNSLKQTKSWKKCQALCNTIELNKRIRAFRIQDVDIENAHKARNMLDPIRVDDVQEVSPGAATFYIWTLGMTEEVFRAAKRR